MKGRESVTLDLGGRGVEVPNGYAGRGVFITVCISSGDHTLDPVCQDPTPASRRAQALADVRDEREREEEIGLRKRAEGIDWRSCADPDMGGGDDKRFKVLGEEVGEVANASLEMDYALTDDARDAEERHLRTELIQVAAVAVAWVEAIDARNGFGNKRRML